MSQDCAFCSLFSGILSAWGFCVILVDHGGLDVAMPHPALQCPDIDAVPQVLRCESVAELVEEEGPM